MDFVRFNIQMFSISDQVIFIGTSVQGEAHNLLTSEDSQKLFEVTRNFKENAFKQENRKYFDEESRKFGDYLYKLLFSGELGRLFNSTEGMLSDSKRMRIFLHIGTANLATIYWELMHENRSFLSQKYQFIRYPMLRQRLGNKINITRPIKMLIIAANPHHDLDIQAEISALDKVVNNLDKNLVEVKKLIEPDATFENIDRELKNNPDIFHFIGHGEYNVNNPESSYLLISNDNDGERFPLAAMSATMAISPLGLIFLNACKTAQGSDREVDNNFVNLAYELIRYGNRYVIAMSHNISDKAANSLSPDFYKGILESLEPIDLVITRCRSNLYSRFSREEVFPTDWCCPVLYTRSEYLNFIEQS